jgi:putative FmdB family regulatory protein
MPTYEYGCTSCGQRIEVFQRIAEDPLTTCGVCGGKLRKVFHPAGIVFKGSGFYATDSRSSSKPPEKKADATTGSGSGDGSSGGSSGGSSSPDTGSGSSSSEGGKTTTSGSSGSKGSKEPSSS